ncbi:MAG: AMP-binding protein [Candidatus Rokubacteria bacterium]|nr:AMP-binding protein [Candidatus Rokubacteria bacterium]
MVTVDRKSGYYDRAKETMSAGARRRYQEEWLRELVRHAWERAPGVRRRMESAGLSLKDLSAADGLIKLPVMKKSTLPDLQKADPPFGGFSTLSRAEVRHVFVSPGPIYEPVGDEVSPWRAEVGLYACGFRPGDVVVNTFLYHLTPAAHLLDRGLAVLGCAVVPTGPGNTDLQVNIIRDLGVNGYVGTPSFLMTILKRADKLGVGRLPLEVAQVAAEPLPESLRRSFEEEYGILTRQHYGTADIGTVAYECREKAGMHIAEDAIFQICDPETGLTLPHGEIGEVVVTVNHRAYPMIRFGTGDLSLLTESPCPCGRTAARMLGWRGRADEVTKVRGMFIHPRQADEVVARFREVARYQVVVTRTGHQDQMTFQVELGEEGVASPELIGRLESAIREVMKVRGEAVIVPGGTIPEGAKKIADQRKWD